MKWKDWLFIPKNDKIAIISLAVIIVILLGVQYAINQHPHESYSITIPEDYKQWQALLSKKEEEKNIHFEARKKFYRNYQPKMEIGETIELNSADTTQLKTIPGISSGYANRIVKYRTSLGGFANIEQVSEVWGMDTYLYSQITPFLTLSSIHDSIYVNLDSFEKLLQHPYLNYKQVMVIEDIRTRKGAIKSLNRLNLLDEFKRKDIQRLKEYINFKE